MKSPEIYGIRVSYNDKFVLKLMNKDIREKKRDQLYKKNRKRSQRKIDKLLRMKPKEYKNISKKENEEIKKTK